jgi:GT2 family glycosyltransferase
MPAADFPVLAVLVATNGEEWLPDAIRALQAQTHDRLDVIAVDNACTDASGVMLSKAFGGNAIALERRVGYGRACAAALKVVAERGMEVEAFLIVHDDASLDPSALEAMVNVMIADDKVGIVGGKLVEWDDSARLQEIGMATDRYGRLFGELERGELDHGQHDGIREVLFCTSASLLVRRAVVERVGLFDPRFVAMRDDLDLCWRARLAGFRTIVTSEARTRHAAAALRGRRSGPVSGATRYFSERNRIATLMKNYSALRLAVVLPVVVVQSVLTAILQVMRGRRGLARQILGALEWNALHAPSTIRARARGRRHRVGGDADVTKFMVRGAPRLRGYVERVFESLVGEPVRGIEETEIGGPPPEDARGVVAFVRQRPVLAGGAVLLLLYLVGMRSLAASGPLTGAGLLPFPSGPGAFFREFLSGWRGAGVAGAHPPAPAALALGVTSVLSFGSTWLAARLLVVVLVPIAAAGAYRSAGRLGLDRSGRLTAGAAYGLAPATLAAFGDGRLPELVLIAATPGLLMPLLRAAWDADPPEPEWRRRAAGVVGLAVTMVFSPWALVFVAGATAAVAAAAALTKGTPVRVLRNGAIMTAGALALLFPWSIELFRAGTPLGVGGLVPAAGMLDLLRLSPSVSTIGLLSWTFPVAAGLGAGLSASRKPRMAFTMLVLAFAGLMAAWASGRLSFVAPRPGLPLAGAAFAFAILAGAGVQAIPSLRARTFGVPHVVAGVAAVSMAAGLAVGTGWFVRGSFPGLRTGGELAPAFLAADVATAGQFRVLWLGGFDRAGFRHAVRVDLTDPRGETMLGYGVRRTSPAESYLVKAVAAILAGKAEQGGRLLAPLGVRQIIVRPDAPDATSATLDRQIDFRYRQTFHGGRVYDNIAWLPVAAPLGRGGGWVAASKGADPSVALLAVDIAGAPLRGLDQKAPARFAGPIDPTATALVLAEPFDGKWRMILEGRSIKPRKAFGFATAFDIPAGVLTPPSPSPKPAPAATKSPAKRQASKKGVTRTPSPSPRASLRPAPATQPGPIALVAWRGQSSTRLLLLVQLGAWVVFAAGWSSRRALERGER